MNLLNAPEQGMMYALYIDRVVYKPYKRDQLAEEALMKNLLEIHLFDQTKEYRYIKKRKGDIEVTIDDISVSCDDKYTERIYTLEDDIENLDELTKDKKRRCIEVVNYISYDENDLMSISNYRLKEVKE